MNKKEKLEQQAAELREKLEQLETTIKELPGGGEKWVPNDGDKYWYIDDDGHACESTWGYPDFHQARLAVGNVFRTEEEAKASVIYAAFHGQAVALPDGDKYEYWFPWMDRPDELPEGCECFWNDKWDKECGSPNDWKIIIRRWPKQKEGGE